MHEVIDWARRQLPFLVVRKSPADYIGTYDCSITALESVFRDNRMVANPVSFVSRVRGVGREKASYAYRETPFAHKQYHVVLFTDIEGIRVYCHEEYNWRRHPYKHLTQQDIDCLSGMQWCNELLRTHDMQQYQL